MSNFILQTMLNNLKSTNPSGFKTINTLMQNNQNPQAILQQLLTGATKDQKEAFLKQAKQYNVPENILAQLQNLK